MSQPRKESSIIGLSRAKKAALARIQHIGCSGWFYWRWRGTFYPDVLSTGGWFKFYSSRFKTVELNAPFYSWPTIHNVQSWSKQTGMNNFIYTVSRFPSFLKTAEIKDS
jgi:hypothetical protein